MIKVYHIIKGCSVRNIYNVEYILLRSPLGASLETFYERY